MNCVHLPFRLQRHNSAAPFPRDAAAFAPATQGTRGLPVTSCARGGGRHVCLASAPEPPGIAASPMTSTRQRHLAWNRERGRSRALVDLREDRAASHGLAGDVPDAAQGGFPDRGLFELFNRSVDVIAVDGGSTWRVLVQDRSATGVPGPKLSTTVAHTPTIRWRTVAARPRKSSATAAQPPRTSRAQGLSWDCRGRLLA